MVSNFIKKFPPLLVINDCSRIAQGLNYLGLGIADYQESNKIFFSENLVPSKIKKGKRVKAVFNKEREGKMTDFFFVPEDEYERWISKPEFDGGT